MQPAQNTSITPATSHEAAGPMLNERQRAPHNARTAPRIKRNIQGFHELAHALVGADEDAPKLTYAQEELVVESIAWSCCQTAQLDTSANSIPYLASWAENTSLDVLEHTAALTARLCDHIDAGLLGPPAADASDLEYAEDEPLAA